jgi:hypothetical protein
MDGHDISLGVTAASLYTKPSAGPSQRNLRFGGAGVLQRPSNCEPFATSSPTIAPGIDSAMAKTGQSAYPGAALASESADRLRASLLVSRPALPDRPKRATLPRQIEI